MLMKKILVSLFLLLPTLVFANKKTDEGLVSMLKNVMQTAEVHPDSVYPCIQKIEAFRGSLSTNEEQAVADLCLGRLYSRWSWQAKYAGFEDYTQRSMEAFRRALANPDMLAGMKAKQWPMLLEEASKDDPFGGDMLSVAWYTLSNSLGAETADTLQGVPTWGEMIRRYESQGNRRAALRLATDSLMQSPVSSAVQEQRLKALLDRYGDLDDAANLYLLLSRCYHVSDTQRKTYLTEAIKRYPKYKGRAQLQNELLSLTDPSFQWNAPKLVYPGRTYDWVMSSRNMQSVEWGGASYVFPADRCDAGWYTDTVRWQAPATLGTYKLSFLPRPRVKTKEKTVPLAAMFMVSRLQMLCQGLPEGVLRIVVVDRMTGEPQQGVDIELFHDDSKGTQPYAHRKTDAQGSIMVSLSKERGSWKSLYARIGAATEPHHEIETLYYYQPWYAAGEETTRHVHLYTDRSIYRPGQEVQVGGILYSQKGWTLRTLNGDSVVLVLRNAAYEEVERKTVHTDSLGVFSATFTLPANQHLGRWSLNAEGYTAVQLRVENYRRPTFTVELADSLQRTADSVYIYGKARRFDGAPLRGARVTGTWWAHSYWRMSLPRKVKPVDTLFTDSEGAFCLSMPKDTVERMLEVQLDVLSSYGEQQQATHSYVLHPFTPRPQEVDSTFLVTCPRDSFDTAHPAEVTFSTNQERAWVYVTLSSDGRVHQDTLLCLTRGSHTFPVPYREEYGKALSLAFATTLNEKVYRENKTLRLSRPDMRLRLRWDSFRDLAQPGDHEQWRLTLLRPDSTPAAANVMATLYDASLDRLIPHTFDLSLSLGYVDFTLPFRGISRNWQRSYTATTLQQARLKEQTFGQYARLDDQWFSQPMRIRGTGGGKKQMFCENVVFTASRSNAKQMAGATPPAAMADAVAEESVEAAEDADAGIAEEEQADPTAALPLRENFEETAYFNARVRTDAQGQAVMELTLPQSTTTWRLRAVVHTADLMHATFGRELVAQKPVMAQARLPRFLRKGDEAVLRGSLTNTTDQAQKVKTTMQVKDAKSGKLLLNRRGSLTLAAKADTTLTYIYKVEDGDVLVRWVVEGEDFSDGEQHTLSVLPTAIDVTNTLPITAPKAGEYTFDLGKLYPKDAEDRALVIQYTAHPEQLAVEALPALAAQKGNSVFSMLTALYGQVVAKKLGVAAEDSIDVLRTRLAKMQRPDGGISWYPGMPGTRYITREVGFQLARLQMLTGEAQDAGMLRKIIGYLLNEDSRVKRMWQGELLRTLYIVQSTDVKLTKKEQAKADSLLRSVKDLKPEDLSLEGQALAAVVLQRQGQKRKAQAMVEAFKSRLVSTPERGTYIEHPQGPMQSVNRKLDIHVQLMEALQLVKPEETALLGGMRQNLLMQKRTQVWDTPINSVNAIYALLANYKKPEQIARDVMQVTWKGKRTVTNIVAGEDEKGYACDTLDVTQLPVQLRLHKLNEGQSWGAAYARFRQEYTAIESDTMGLAVRQDVPVGLKAGSRVTLTQRIMADTDYEYVTVSVPRPANLEAVDLISGCRWQDGLCYYLEVQDSRLLYHILSLPRGHYRFRQDYYVERPGTYHTGVSTIECSLAPEYQGRDADHTLTVE